MTVVEQEFYPSFVWAEPLEGHEFDVRVFGSELYISGVLPTYQRQDLPSDLILQYELVRWKRRTTKHLGKCSPHIVFANADSDQKLIAFVRAFGPVVAKSVQSSDHNDGEGILLTAKQDMPELRRERSLYQSALSLVLELKRSSSTPRDTYDDELAKSLIRKIAGNIQEWPRQWEREGAQRKQEPLWRPSAAALNRIEQMGSSDRSPSVFQKLDARLVICELVNIFPSLAFPNPLELNSSIRHGIRPLLYAILRREFLNHRATANCANSQCRNFFEIEREGQQFCDPVCSRQQRQREYWSERGKKLRSKRLKQRKPRFH